MLLSITEFTNTPGPRYKALGEFSGEEFRDNWLKPRYTMAQTLNEPLEIDLDGAYGYPSSFLSEAFAGMVAGMTREEALDFTQRLKIKCDDSPYLIDDIVRYMQVEVLRKIRMVA